MGCKSSKVKALPASSSVPELADPSQVTYIARSARDPIRTSAVRGMVLVCHPETLIPGTNKPSNHWTMSFDVGNGRGVTLDIVPNYSRVHEPNQGIEASIVVSLSDCVFSKSAVKSIPISVKRQRTVGWYMDYLRDQNAFNYAFNPKVLAAANGKGVL